MEPLSPGTLDLAGKSCVLCAHRLALVGEDSVVCPSGHRFRRYARYGGFAGIVRAGGRVRFPRPAEPGATHTKRAALPQERRSAPPAGDLPSPVATVTAIPEVPPVEPRKPTWPMGSLCGTDWCADPCCRHAPPDPERPEAVLEELREREEELTERERALRASRSWRMEMLAEIQEERAKRA